MISVNDFKTGLTIEVDGSLWRVIDFQHVKPGKGAAFVRSKLRNLRNGAIQERHSVRVKKWQKHKSIIAKCSIYMQTVINTYLWILNHTIKLNYQKMQLNMN